jgi:hypothetical protein
MGFRRNRAERSAIKYFEESFIKLKIEIYREALSKEHLLGQNSV